MYTYMHACTYIYTNSFKDSTGAHDCTLCHADFPLTVGVASVEASQCMNDDGAVDDADEDEDEGGNNNGNDGDDDDEEDFYDTAEFIVPVAVGPIAVVGTLTCLSFRHECVNVLHPEHVVDFALMFYFLHYVVSNVGI